MLSMEGHPMESVFLACFLFGAVFTLASAVLGHAGHGSSHDGAAGHGHDVSHAPPLLNFTSLVAFLTWFGAGGYAALQFGGWPVAGAILVGLVAGLAGAVLIALFLGRVMAGERVMDARQYRLPGTLARVTIGIPAQGVGEIVFVKEGVRRSEAARSRNGRPIPRDAQVVILEYGKGVAAVQPFDELLNESGRPVLDEQEPGSRLPAPESSSPSGV
jgi:hypothetical protein